MQSSNDNTENRTRDLSDFTSVPQPTAPPPPNRKLNFHAGDFLLFHILHRELLSEMLKIVPESFTIRYIISEPYVT